MNPKCPRCGAGMETSGDFWICPNCGYDIEAGQGEELEWDE